MSNNKSKWKIYMILAFLVSFIPRVIVALSMIPFRTISDELATLSSAAYLSGNNWGDVVSKSGYYGFGYYWIYFIVFKITDNPIIIYRAILLFSSLLQASVSLISFIMLHKFFDLKNNIVKLLLSIISSYLVVTRVSITYNEHMLIFISWLIGLIICFLWKSFINENILEKRKYTIILVLILTYSLTIHTRSIIYFIAIFVVNIIFYIFNKKQFLSRLFLPLFAIGYFLINLIIKLVQNKLWLLDANENLRNSEISITLKYDLLNINTWKSIIGIWIGQITTIAVFSCGLFLVAVLALIIVSYGYLKKVKTEDENISLCILLGWICFLCIGATILAQSLIWLPGVVEGMNQELSNGNYYGYKAFTYVRYFGPYIGVFIMAGLLLIYYKIDKVKKYRRILLIVFISFKFYWYKFIFPYMQTNDSAKEVFIAFSNWKYRDKITVFTYLSGFLILSGFITIYLFCDNLRKLKLILFITLVVLVFEYGYLAFYHDYPIAKENQELIDKSYNFMTNIDFVLKDIGIKDIYVIDSSKKTDHQTYYLLQFYLNRYHIIPELPKESVRDIILFSNSEIDEDVIGDKCQKIILDTNEYVYISNEIMKKIKDSNINLSYK